MKTDLMSMPEEFYETEINSQSINSNFTYLVPRKKGSIGINDYRPINLNSHHKMLQDGK